MTIFHLLRPAHWIKNLLLLVPVVMSGNLRQGELVLRAVLAFMFFCWLASAGYVCNDWQDRDRDREHPKKALRPIAADLVSPTQALLAGAWLMLMGLVGLWVLGPGLVVVGGAYLVLAIGYTVFFKQQPGVDAVAVTLLYLLRVEAGAQVMNTHASPWLLALTGALALPICLAKRQAEQKESGVYALLSGAGWIYTVLYTVAFLIYVAFSLSQEVVDRSSQAGLAITLPFVAMGLLLLNQGRAAGKMESPIMYFYSSAPLQVAAVGWALTCFLALYGPL